MEKQTLYTLNTHTMASTIPLYWVSWAPLDRSWSRVLTTSKGLTARAARDPPAHPAKNEHQNTASPAQEDGVFLDENKGQTKQRVVFEVSTFPPIN